MAARLLFAPDLLRPALLPLCDAVAVLRLLAASRALREEVQHLRTLVVSFPKEEPLEEEAVHGLARTVDVLAGLHTLSLSLSYQELGPGAAGELARAVRRSRKLTSVAVDLRHNGLGDAGALEWARAVMALSGLTSLDLRLGFNRIGPKAALELVRALKGLGSLTDLCLELDINHIGDAAACEAACVVMDLTHLTCLRLDFGHCRLREPVACAFAGALDDGLAGRVPASLKSVDIDLRGNSIPAAARSFLTEAAACLERRGCRCLCRA